MLFQQCILYIFNSKLNQLLYISNQTIKNLQILFCSSTCHKETKEKDSRVLKIGRWRWRCSWKISTNNTSHSIIIYIVDYQISLFIEFMCLCSYTSLWCFLCSHNFLCSIKRKNRKLNSSLDQWWSWQRE